MTMIPMATQIAGAIFSFKKILVLIIDGLYAVILVCSVALMMVASFGEVNLGFGESIKLVITSLVLATVASVGVFFVRSGVKKDTSVV